MRGGMSVAVSPSIPSHAIIARSRHPPRIAFPAMKGTISARPVAASTMRWRRNSETLPLLPSAPCAVGLVACQCDQYRRGITVAMCPARTGSGASVGAVPKASNSRCSPSYGRSHAKVANTCGFSESTSRSTRASMREMTVSHRALPSGVNAAALYPRG